MSTSYQQLNEELLILARSAIIDEGKLNASLNIITETLTLGLGIERGSVWFFNEDASKIICHDLYQRETKIHSIGLELNANDFPAYFKYLFEERILSAPDAETNPDTRDFLDAYLRPLNIKSMLDAPIRSNGKMIGVVCAEMTKEKRDWTEHEQNFIGNIADVIARAIQAKKKTDALNELEKINANLEQIIKERTKELETQQLISQYSSKMASLGQMASSIGHEINNPLTIIIGNAEYLNHITDTKELTPEILKILLEKMINSSKRISKIVKSLRHLSRDSHNDSMELVRISQIFDETESLCMSRFRTHGCSLSIEATSPTLKINCQSVSIGQVLINLLNNSLDAVAVLTDKWVKVEARENGDITEIRVIDSGKGIPKHLQDNIFAPFFTTKPPGSGTGLGLAISQGILQKHGGKITIDHDHPNTCFVISLPKT